MGRLEKKEHRYEMEKFFLMLTKLMLFRVNEMLRL